MDGLVFKSHGDDVRDSAAFIECRLDAQGYEAPPRSRPLRTTGSDPNSAGCTTGCTGKPPPPPPDSGCRPGCTGKPRSQPVSGCTSGCTSKPQSPPGNGCRSGCTGKPQSLPPLLPPQQPKQQQKEDREFCGMSNCDPKRCNGICRSSDDRKYR